ncbi:MAG: GDYXXLXY domain-containing protein [Pseudomonadota bacterium]
MNGDLGRYRLRALVSFIVIAGFLAVALFNSERIRSQGEEITVRTRPIDPRDIFFGHYATLDYEIERIADAKDKADEGLLAAAEQKRAEDAWGIDNGPAYLILEKGPVFHDVSRVTLSLDDARQSGAPFLKASWTIMAVRDCPGAERRRDVCGYKISIQTELPSRYYADQETALALEDRQRDRQRLEASIRRFDRCMELREEMINDPDGEEPAICEGVSGARPVLSAPNEFGVILSTSNDGEAVIKGVMVGGVRYIDTLTGPRLVKADFAEGSE